MPTLYYIILVFTAFAGLLLSVHIWDKKKSQKPLVCPLKADCHSVITSQYSKFLGIPLEFIGMGYYSLIAISYGLALTVPGIISQSVSFIVLAITLTAFLFSMYLTTIQFFVLKQLCSWCLTSAGLCTIIAVLVILVAPSGLSSMLAAHVDLLVLVHILGMAIGIGAATITDIFFFRFLRDFKISEFEADILKTLSHIIWVALALIVISGVGLFIPESNELLRDGGFLAKLVLVGVLIINGLFLNVFVSPKLLTMSFTEKHAHQTGELRRLRRRAFMMGAISITTWYGIFILVFARRSIELSFTSIIFIYSVVLIIALVCSQIMEKLFIRASKK